MMYTVTPDQGHNDASVDFGFFQYKKKKRSKKIHYIFRFFCMGSYFFNVKS